MSLYFPEGVLIYLMTPRDLCFQLRGPSLTTKHSPANSIQLNRPCLPSVHQLLQPIPAHDSYSSALSVCCLHIVAAGLKIIVHVWKKQKKKHCDWKHSWQYHFVVRVWCLFLDITTCSMFLLLRFLDQYVLNRSGFQRSQLFQLIFFFFFFRLVKYVKRPVIM